MTRRAQRLALPDFLSYWHAEIHPLVLIFRSDAPHQFVEVVLRPIEPFDLDFPIPALILTTCPALKRKVSIIEGGMSIKTPFFDFTSLHKGTP